MDIEILHNELHSRFFSKGKLVVETTTNIPGQPMPRFDNIWMLEAEPSEVNFHISDLQTASPLVIFDIKDEMAMSYSLGAPTANVMQAANAQYATKPLVLAKIKEYADLILESYQVAINYDKAWVLHEKFLKVKPSNPQLLKDAWSVISSVKYSNDKYTSLANAISATAKNNQIIL